MTTASRLPVPALWRTFSATSSTNRRDHQRPVRTTRSRCSPRRAKAANASRSPGACSRSLDAEFRSTGSPCCCVHRRSIAPTSRRHSTEPTFRFISHVARCDPTRPGAPSVPCSSAPPKACRRGASPSTFRLGRCLTRRPAARRRRLAPRGDRWIAPDPELVPLFTTDEVGEQPAPAEADLAAARIDDAPVRDGQLRAPRRWERLLVEAAVIGGRDRWRRRIDGLANDLRLRLAELGEEDETQAATLAANARRSRRLRWLRPPSHR